SRAAVRQGALGHRSEALFLTDTQRLGAVEPCRRSHRRGSAISGLTRAHVERQCGEGIRRSRLDARTSLEVVTTSPSLCPSSCRLSRLFPSSCRPSCPL